MSTYTYKITEVEPIYVQADNGHQLSVGVELYRDGEAYGFRRLGFPLGTEKEQLLAELDKLCATLSSDEENSAKSAELDAQLTAAAKLKEDLLS